MKLVQHEVIRTEIYGEDSSQLKINDDGNFNVIEKQKKVRYARLSKDEAFSWVELSPTGDETQIRDAELLNQLEEARRSCIFGWKEQYQERKGVI
jgi:hypothetical protein